MLVIRAVPLSLSILWQLVLYTPVIVLSNVLLGIAFFVYSGILSIFFHQWLSFLIAIIAIVLIGSTIPTMIGARIGLQNKGVKENIAFHKMYWVLLGYGAVEGMIATIPFLVAAKALHVLTGLSFGELMTAIELEQVETLEPHYSTLIMLFLVFAGSLLALRAALLVTYAGASINADTSGHGHTPFAGFGAAFFPMLIVVVIASCVVPIVTCIFMGVFVSQDLELGMAHFMFELMELMFRGRSEYIGWADVPRYIAAISLGFWTFSLQSAAAVLVFLERKEAAQAEQKTYAETLHIPPTPRMAPEEVRALWKSRM